MLPQRSVRRIEDDREVAQRFAPIRGEVRHAEQVQGQDLPRETLPCPTRNTGPYRLRKAGTGASTMAWAASCRTRLVAKARAMTTAVQKDGETSRSSSHRGKDSIHPITAADGLIRL